MAIHEYSHQVTHKEKRRGKSQQRFILSTEADVKTQAPWWQVYLMAFILLALLSVIPTFIVNTTTTIIMETTAVLIFYGGLLRWVYVHEAQLNLEHRDNIRDRDEPQR